MADKFVVSTPGRICLFGEHQDYLHLPVIAAFTIGKDRFLLDAKEVRSLLDSELNHWKSP
jgi:hypothetical protein